MELSLLTNRVLGHTTLEERLFRTIGQWMPTGQNLPDVLQGIYFMDGNELPDDCLTLNATWEAETLSLKLPVFGPRQWTFQPSPAGRRLFSLVKALRLTYEIRFQDETLRHAIVIPTILGIRIPRWITEFTMTQTNDSRNSEAWDRRNTVFFRLIPAGGYILRKIVDGQGAKLPAFDAMLTQVQETCLVAMSSEEPDQKSASMSSVPDCQP